MAHEPESLIVTTDTGDRIHYLDYRGGATALPPILLIHGLASTAWSWAPVARRLADHTRVLAMDLRGHGLSDSARSGYDLESLSFDALTVLTANGFGADAGGPPAVVAGHGLGALIAATMGVLRPASVGGVALIDGGWEDVEEATSMTAAEFERSIGDPPEVMASMDSYLADRRAFDLPSWDADQERAARAAVDEKHAGHVALVARPHAIRGSIDAMFEYRPIATLGALTQPVFLAVAETGAADDEVSRERLLALDDVARARSERGLVPMTVRRFPGAGHNLMRYRPAELTSAMLELLNEANAYQRS